MQTSTRRHTRLLGAALLACVSCSTPTEPANTTVPTTAPASLVRVVDQYAGGQWVFDSLHVDSASGIWRRTRCGPASATMPICGGSTEVRDSGVVIAEYRASLFARARQPAFLSLNDEYRRTGVTPPDGSIESLAVIQNGRRKTVRWESGAAVPNTVFALVCHLEVARGSLILCAE